MANYPTGKDALTENIKGTDPMANHAELHNMVNGAVNAIQDFVGLSGGTDKETITGAINIIAETIKVLEAYLGISIDGEIIDGDPNFLPVGESTYVDAKEIQEAIATLEKAIEDLSGGEGIDLEKYLEKGTGLVAINANYVLDQSSYCIPSDFDDHRRIFQHTNFGREQLFSIYCELFYPGTFSSWEGVVPLKKPSSRPLSARPRSLLRRINLIAIARRILSTRSPKLGILNSYFSHEHTNRLILQSLGRIQNIPLPEIPLSPHYPDWELRDKLVLEEVGFDRFDRFVFASLRCAMPKVFVENFPQIFTSLNLYFDQFSCLRWVVSEAWIGHSLSSMALAVLRLRGVRHIYNEHNYLSHFFLGNSVKYLASMVDEFVTLGWANSSISNLVRGASLFQWSTKERLHEKQHKILFILGLPIAYVPEISAAYGDSGSHGAIGYFEMSRSFLAKLGTDTLSELYVRSYPAWKISDWLTWDQFFELKPFLEKVKAYDDTTASGQLLMQESRLVVVNYLSTAYLESIVANIPTVFFWNRGTNLFEEKHMRVFDEMIKVGICQTVPGEAADFINRIKDDPESWWKSQEVQKARKIFLDLNFGKPEIMINHLLAKTIN